MRYRRARPGLPAAVTPTRGTPQGIVRVPLEREPATSIRHEFRLDVISRYFPGYSAVSVIT